MLLASAADAIGSSIGSSGFLGFVLGGGLLTALIGAYRFYVNYRLTERGIARDRVDQAVRDQQAERRRAQRAERAKTLWQARCGDLEWAMRRAGVPVPPMSAELHVLAFGSGESDDEDAGPGENRRPARARRRSSRDATQSTEDDGGTSLIALEDRLRRQELDEARLVDSGDTGDADDDTSPREKDRS